MHFRECRESEDWQDELVEQETQGSFVGHGWDDILTTAIGKREHPGHSISTNTDEKFLKMENELITLKNQLQTWVAYIASRDDVADHFAVMAAGLVYTSVNEVPNVGSGALSPIGIRRSSGTKKTS
ncbi:hypothetical protein DEO72_LG10g2442 [Vigna unguiculata]|uniref:Uncharacterized protein n=1 Tax=Vigna unguiculata TaxID=3917 RepID=A0A4D6NFB5_VIGUN|nr:hypothetical protein DEO72_LG10g2442 [Vigna unguiculata]